MSWLRTCSYVCVTGTHCVCGTGDCTRLAPTLSDPRETSGPRIDRIPLARLTTSAPRIKKLFFSPSSKRSIDLFGPVSNRTILKQLHVVSQKRTGFSRRAQKPQKDTSAATVHAVTAVWLKQPPICRLSSSCSALSDAYAYPLQSCCTKMAHTHLLPAYAEAFVIVHK